MSSGPLEEKIRAYMRYQGQGHEVSVLIDQVEIVDSRYLRQRFESVYRETYGRVLEEVEAVCSRAVIISNGKPIFF